MGFTFFYICSSLTLNLNIMFFSLLNDGGPIFMYPLFIILILVLILIVKGFLQKGNIDKTMSLIGSIGLFAVVWGFLGQILGLIAAFDAIELAGDVSPAIRWIKNQLFSSCIWIVYFLNR
jgi:hypothetical protein